MTEYPAHLKHMTEEQLKRLFRIITTAQQQHNNGVFMFDPSVCLEEALKVMREAKPDPNSMEENVKALLDGCPYRRSDMSGDLTGIRGVESLIGSLVLTFMGMQHRLKELNDVPLKPTREPFLPYLSDRADGVKGHFAISRWNPAGYREVWNIPQQRWASASDVPLTQSQATELLMNMTLAQQTQGIDMSVYVKKSDVAAALGL